jgi:heme/copper-type cytochrome/quinol oxidase subunit 2
MVKDGYSQCAMCKAAAESNLESDPKSIARGLNKGILFLMAIPYVIVGIIFKNDIILIFKNIRTQKRIELSKERKQWLRFALFFATILIILFLIFLKVQYDTLK